MLFLLLMGIKIQDNLKGRCLKIHVYRGMKWLKIIKINLVPFQNTSRILDIKCKIDNSSCIFLFEKFIFLTIIKIKEDKINYNCSFNFISDFAVKLIYHIILEL